MKEKAAYKKILILAGMFLLLITGLCMKPYTVKADTATFRAAGKTYYMETGKTQTLLYLKNGNRYRLVAENKQSFMKYKFVYGKKLYFVAGGEEKPCVTYSYAEGKSGFQKVGTMYLLSHRGKYAVGYTSMAGDPQPSSLCLFNLSSGKLTRLGKGCDIKFIGDKIYYASVRNSYTMQIVRRNASGSGKKVIKTIKTSKNNRLSYVGNITAHSARCYYIINGKWVEKNVRF